jgi:hypothetical protein
MFILAEAQYVGVRLTLDADALTMEPADDMAPQWWNGFRTAIEIFEPEIIELMKAHDRERRGEPIDPSLLSRPEDS